MNSRGLSVFKLLLVLCTLFIHISDNNRGISLFNSICKLFDHIILLLFGGQLEASDMQFGFKRGHSTVMCSLIFKEIVDHYLHLGSNVYSCLLDVSKAFDRVHYGTLFRLLLKKDVPRCVIRLVFDSYIRQKACATWNKQMSEYFTMENGVKQGGVISPISLAYTLILYYYNYVIQVMVVN